jgi:hypothetical protein
MSRKTTTGANDRSKDATIAQSGPGIPDDSGAEAVLEDEERQATEQRKETPQERLKKEVADEVEASKRGAE